MFLWSVIHKAVAVNVWRHRASSAILVGYPICPRTCANPSSIDFTSVLACSDSGDMHKRSCNVFTERARPCSTSALAGMPLQTSMAPCTLKVPLRVVYSQRHSPLAILDRVQCASICFRRLARAPASTGRAGVLLDAGRAAWFKAFRAIRQHPHDSHWILIRFDTLWMFSPQHLGHRTGMVVTWIVTRPREVFLI